jgi:glucans biosynthesis protein C
MADTPSEAKTARYHDMDALRLALMLCAVLTHAGAVYASHRPNITSNTDRSEFFAWLINGLHLVVSPAFFAVSGFFLILMLSRSQWNMVLRERLYRLVLPTITAGLTFNVVELYLRYRDKGGSLSFPNFISSADARALLTTDSWQLHLWFLVYLAFFTLLPIAAFALAPHVPPAVRRLPQKFGDALGGLAGSSFGLFGLLVLMTLTTVIGMAATGRLPGAYDNIIPGLITPYKMASYLPYFLFGCLVFVSARLREGIWTYRRWMPFAMAICFIAQPYGGAYGDNLWFKSFLMARPELANVLLLGETFSYWVFVVGGIQLTHRYFQNPNALLKRWVERSQSIYLFHHSLVYIAGVVLSFIALPIGLEFILVAIFAIVGVVVIHALVESSSLLLLLFAGRGKFGYRPPKKPAFPEKQVSAATQ